jgi:hypothetical protein
MTTTHVIATLAGGGAEAAGFFLIYREIRRTRRDELGETSRLAELWAGVRYTIDNPAPQIIARTGGASVTVSAGGHLKLTTAADEDPLDALDRRFTALAAELSDHKDK